MLPANKQLVVCDPFSDTIQDLTLNIRKVMADSLHREGGYYKSQFNGPFRRHNFHIGTCGIVLGMTMGELSRRDLMGLLKMTNSRYTNMYIDDYCTYWTQYLIFVPDAKCLLLLSNRIYREHWGEVL